MPARKEVYGISSLGGRCAGMHGDVLIRPIKKGYGIDKRKEKRKMKDARGEYENERTTT